MSSQQLSYDLPDGGKMPRIGLGTSVGSDPADHDRVEQMVYDAIKVGYRHIDTAAFYDTEPAVGRGIARAIADGLVNRADLFVVTKVWNDMHDAIEESMDLSLQRLGLDYVDLFHVHWPVHWKRGTWDYYESEHPSLLDVWDQMENCYHHKKTRYLGVCNYSEAQVKETWEHATVKPIINQVECTPYWNQFQLQNMMKPYNMHITAYSALFPKGDYEVEWRDMAADPVIQAIAAKHGKTVQQVILRWQLDVGNSVITKSFVPERLQQNFDILKFELDQTDLDQMAQFKQARYRNPSTWFLPVKKEFFWPKEESGL